MHSCALLKTNRLSKQHWLSNRMLDMPKKHPHSPDGLDQCEKCHSPTSASQENYLHLQEEASCITSGKSVSNVKKSPKKEESCNSGKTFSSVGNPCSCQERDKLDGKVYCRTTEECSSGTLSLQDIAAAPGLPMRTYSCSSAANAAKRQTSSCRDVCCLGTQPLMLQKSISAQLQPSTHSNPLGSSFWTFPFDFIGAGTCHEYSNVSAEGRIPLSLGPKAHKVEPQGQSFADLDPLRRKEQPKEGSSYSSLKEQLLPGSRAPPSASVGRKAKLLPEVSVPSINACCLGDVPVTYSAPRHHGSGGKHGASLQSNGGHGKLCETGASTFQEPSCALHPAESTASSGSPYKTDKKRGLEMMRKQTCVEFDDTSSDDEDRLVIEM